uniref:Reverse transcriptase domain-containing protein n=1 Tax=Crocodylus porosus TaxID=8502 RepID=A0A7M4FAT3_CROPO
MKVIGWVKVLYSKAGSQVLVNGYLSKAFPIQTGVRQGCPLSHYLFVCIMEPLAWRIYDDKLISDVKIPG